MSDNLKTADKAVAVEQKKFLAEVEKITTLKRPEIISLAKIYGLGGFFEKYSSRIIEKKLGEKIAEIVLFILKIRAIKAESRENIYKTANENPKLTAGLRSWLMDQSIGELGDTDDCKLPAPVATAARVQAPALIYVPGKHDGWESV